MASAVHRFHGPHHHHYVPATRSGNSSHQNNSNKAAACCDLCHKAPALVSCLDCENSIFCSPCDLMYHKHLERRYHLRKSLSPVITRNAIPKQVTTMIKPMRSGISDAEPTIQAPQMLTGKSNQIRPPVAPPVPVPPPRRKRSFKSLIPPPASFLNRQSSECTNESLTDQRQEVQQQQKPVYLTMSDITDVTEHKVNGNSSSSCTRRLSAPSVVTTQSNLISNCSTSAANRFKNNNNNHHRNSTPLVNRLIPQPLQRFLQLPSHTSQDSSPQRIPVPQSLPQSKERPLLETKFPSMSPEAESNHKPQYLHMLHLLPPLLPPPPPDPLPKLQEQEVSASSRLYGSASELSRLISGSSCDRIAPSSLCPSPSPTVASVGGNEVRKRRSLSLDQHQRNSSLQELSNPHNYHSSGHQPIVDDRRDDHDTGCKEANKMFLNPQSSCLIRAPIPTNTLPENRTMNRPAALSCTCGIPPPPPPLQFTRYFVQRRPEQPPLREEHQEQRGTNTQRYASGISRINNRVWTGSPNQPLKLRSVEEGREANNYTRVIESRDFVVSCDSEKVIKRGPKQIQRPGFLKRTVAAVSRNT